MRRKRHKGYVRLANRYVSQKFLAAVYVCLLAAMALYAVALHPTAARLWFAYQKLPSFRIDSPYLAAYTGDARLLLPDGSLLYEGRVENAAAEGRGKLYHQGALVYEGGFAGNAYDGEGVLYDERGGVLYAGPFENGAYVGSGTLRAERGGLQYTYVGDFDAGAQNGAGKLYAGAELVYDGQFANGAYHGAGKQYEGGALVYEGAFANGRRDGAGKLYGADGLPIYEGGFSDDLFSGAGRLYEGGALRYAGDWQNGLYDGIGALYDETGLVYAGGFALGAYNGAGKLYAGGALRYDGLFAKGAYSGAGKLYDGDGRLLYDGGFRANRYDGDGKLFQDGVLLYEGAFSLGAYNGDGAEYDIATGFPVFAGKYAGGRRLEAGTAYDAGGAPIDPNPPPEPEPEPEPEPPAAPRLDPLTLLNYNYAEAVGALAKAGVTIKEQIVGDRMLGTDEANGVTYDFTTRGGAPGYVSRIYYYGLLAAEGVVVGTDASRVPRAPDAGAPDDLSPSTVELLTIARANAFRNRDVSEAALKTVTYATERYVIDVFYQPDADAGPSAPSGKILLLRITLNTP